MLICPSLLCHRIVSSWFDEEIAASPNIASPCKIYRPWFKTPFNITIEPFITLRTPFFRPEIIAICIQHTQWDEIPLSFGTNLTFSRTLWEPSYSLNLTEPNPVTLHDWSFPINTFPPWIYLKFIKHSLLGVMWKVQPESNIHSSQGLKSKIISPSPLSYPAYPLLYPSEMFADSDFSLPFSCPFFLGGQFLRICPSFLQNH